MFFFSILYRVDTDTNAGDDLPLSFINLSGVKSVNWSTMTSVCTSMTPMNEIGNFMQNFMWIEWKS